MSTPPDHDRPSVGRDAGADLALVEQVADRWCSALDPDLLTGGDAASAVERLATTIRRLEAAQLKLTRRAEACNAYAARAHSAADYLANQNGISRGQARRALETARRLEAHPQTAAAFADGEISLDEADAVSGAAQADPGCEARLLDGARENHDLRETRLQADKIRRAARSAEDEGERHERLHRTRGLRIGESPDGHVEIRGQFTPRAFAGVKPIIDAFMKLRLEQARRDGTRDGWDAYRADAFLAAMAAGTTAAPPSPATRSATSADPNEPEGQVETTAAPRLFSPGGDLAEAEGLDPEINWNLVVLVDGIALKRGYAAPGETCEIPGIGPIPISWIQQLLPHGQVEMLVHDTVDIRAYATTTRHRTRPVDLGVRVRDRECVIPRCHNGIAEIDHRVPFVESHDTSTANVEGLCNLNHDDKTYRGGTLDRTDSHWLWWPPGRSPGSDPPMTAPVGAHLTRWNLDHLPGATRPDDIDTARCPDEHDPPTLDLG